MRIEVLGPVRLRDHAGDVVEVPERKVRALLAALSAADGKSVSPQTLLDQVWGAALPANPARVLQSKLSQLRNLLESAGGGGRGILVREPGGYRLVAGHRETEGPVSGVETDADVLRRGVARARAATEPAERLALLNDIHELWRGRPYGEFADELWASADTAALEELHLQAVELQAAALLETGSPEPAYTVLRPLLQDHPTREPLVVAAMRACYLTGRHPESLRLYERLRTHLADELGADPSAATQELHQKILRQDPQLTPAPGPGDQTQAQSGAPGSTASGESPRGNLPRHGSPLIGRETESAALESLVRDQRLVTVLGVGGVGKTRLTTAVAAGIVRTRQDNPEAGTTGVGSAWFADLTALAARETVESITGQLVALLKLPAAYGDHETLLSRVAAVLDERRALLVLDNCEHVVDAVSYFTAELLGRTEHVRVLATSREPLGLPEEQRFPLTPLAVESTGPADEGSSAQDGAGRRSQADGAVQRSRAPAVTLFLARTRTVAPHLQLSDQDLGIIAELCRRLDGLPLAIELAAGRMNTLAPRGLLDRITDRLDLLARPGRGAPRRQQTLRGVLDWSWELLDETERALLRRLAVHPASWTLDAIEAVCADNATGTDAADCGIPPGAAQEEHRAHGLRGVRLRRAEVLPTLARLVDRSLVSTVHIQNGGGTAVRYRLLETVATYATEKLEDSAERPGVASRHLSYYRALADCARGFLFGPHARDWMDWIDQEQAHLDHAHAEALRIGDGANAVGLTLSTFWHRWMTGRVGGLVQTLRATQACPGPRDNAHKQVAVLAARADERDDVHHWSAEITAALDAFGGDDQAVLARMQVQWFPATMLIVSEDYRRTGEQLADEAIGYLVDHGDLHGAAFATTQRDWFLLDHWDVPPQGLPGGHDAEAVLRERGDSYGLILLLSVLHMRAENEGRTAVAESIAEEALGLAVSLDLDGEAAYWYPIRALNSLRAGDFEAAEQAIEAALALARSVAFWYGEVFAFAARAAGAAARGDTARAAEILNSISAPGHHHGARWVTRILGDEALPTPDEAGRA
ncbi:AfsR/SARP family transcriptional regulator [Nocardiopsis oceani]